ncbi:MAG: peptidylprolyl isomerase, partial [Alphaproteobacteria bacterium]
MALKELRKAGKGWIAGMFLIILVSSFAVWGVSDIFNARGGQGVASVGGEAISTAAFQERLRFASERVARQVGKPSLTLEEAKAMGLPQQVLDQMVNERLINRIGTKMGLAVHDDTLKRMIRETPAFQNATGQFDENLYKSVLSQNNLTPLGYVHELRSEILRSQLIDAVTGGAQMPRGLLATLIGFRGEMRAVNYVALDPKIIGEIPAPSKAALEAIINADKDAYSTPELRTFTALVIRPEDRLSEVTLTDAELEEQYKFRVADFTTPEQRSLRIVTFPDEAAAREAMGALQSKSKTFEDVGRSRGLSGEALAYKL